MPSDKRQHPIRIAAGEIMRLSIYPAETGLLSSERKAVSRRFATSFPTVILSD